jgi:general secretion pathway protein C
LLLARRSLKIHGDRYFPVVVLVLIGTAAYFQASGLGWIVASSAAPTSSDLPAVPPPSSRKPVPAPTNPDHSTTGAAILARNPFDSVTGPLDKAPAPEPEPQPESVEAADFERPCDSGRVLLITWSEAPEWSFASIAGRDGKSILRRVSDEVDGHKVEAIEWNRVLMSSGDGKRCQMVIGEKPGAQSRSPLSGSPPGLPPSRREERGGEKRTRVPEEITSKIHKIDDTHFEVERPVIAQILEKQAELLGRARVAIDSDGLRISGVRSDSLLSWLGVENGDKLQSINGIDISDTQKLIAAYPTLLSADHVDVSMLKGGAKRNISINVK